MPNAVAVMRISSEKQSFEGDSIEHQKEQIDLYASVRDITIKKYFIFIESASKEQQPVQEAIDYCKSRKNNIQFFIIKSIDRFTRAGSSLYEHMKTELDKQNVQLVDLYGIIANQKVNTLQHLGIEYPWSVYNPNKKLELLEAERGKDEVRDILSRMIGTEIRYARLGYRVRPSILGYQNVRIETPHGKRIVLEPHPIEAEWIKQIFLLRVQGFLDVPEIIERVNQMGFITRRKYRRDQSNRTKVIGLIGKRKLHLSLFYRIIHNPIYAAISEEKWTNNLPIKCKFEGLISIDIFNKANEGKILIVEDGEKIEIIRGKNITRRMRQTQINAIYPYRRMVVCEKGRHFYYASSSRGKLGVHYPAYHCDIAKRGHYVRIPLKKFHETIINYLKAIRIKKVFIEKIHQALVENKSMAKENEYTHKAIMEQRIKKIKNDMELLIEKIKMLQTESAIKPLEIELQTLDQEKKQIEMKLKAKQEEKITVKSTEDTQLTNLLPQSLIEDHSFIPKKQLFDLLFPYPPTYTELVNKTAILNKEFELAENLYAKM